MLNFLVGLVGATGIEPVTPTVSRWGLLAVRRWKSGLNWVGLRDLPGFCRGAVAGLAIVAVAGCDDPPSPEVLAKKNRETQTPVVIAQADGVKLWKVYDTTPGGTSWVYFTSGGDAYWEHRTGKTTTRWMVPGVKP